MTRPVLHICTTCRAGEALAPGAAPMGALVHDAALALAPDDVAIRPVACLASCEQGCAAAVSMPGRWTYLIGHLTPAIAHDLLDFARLYAASKTGAVMPSRRPESLRQPLLARFPDLSELPA